MLPPASSPGELDGHGLAILLLLNFHCRVHLPETSREARRALMLLLMDLIYQAVPPTASLDEFLGHVRSALACEPEQAEVVCEYLNRTLEILEVTDGLTKLFNESKTDLTMYLAWPAELSRILAPYETLGMDESPEVFVDRRSFFGLYFRRQKLVFDSLDLEARGRLRDVAFEWKEGLLPPHASNDALHEAEGTEDSRMTAYKQFQRAMLTGDYSTAKDSMQKSFDYFAPGSDHELHQHTLLHLASFHYQTGGLDAARAALEEAVSLARSADDLECVAMCESLMRRLQGEGTSRRSMEDKSPGVQRQLSSQDALWRAETDAGKGDELVEVLQQLVRSAQPPRANVKATKSSVDISLHLIDDASRRFGNDAARPDAVVGHLWQDLGQGKVANVYLGRAARARGEVAAAQREGRIKARCEKASKLARRGRYEHGLGLLLRPSTYEALSAAEYRAWTEAVWGILWLRARRRREAKTLSRLAQLDPSSHHVLRDADIEDLVETPKTLQELLPSLGPRGAGASEKKPASEANFQRRLALSSRQKIELLLDKAQMLMDAKQPARAQSPALTAIAMARAQAHEPLERAGIVTLSRIAGISYQLPIQALASLEEVLPLTLADEDLEVRAMAQWTYAECLLGQTKSAGDPSTITEALDWLDRAERDTETISLIHVQRKVLYFMARVLHQLDRAEERDRVADKLAAVERDCLRASEAVCTESLAVVDDVLDVVNLVGAHVASGGAAAIRLSMG
ncbi:uncharacterized protein PFL1_00131 [Pseudozyma flocculosa PF-1]|uniref:uncharacterized protein n=1 Tax=Pseudozyma flocculosa PF-1 TaxID=1277687 RepID=UPI0004561899|nr:uncharacterized protein PFL1_00131 [Pseudozyma flocculosa PF-1]EPQ31932.1 hypothetical protein PFL1_00131 [Pseudozyma flocculosa PF-1]